MEKKHLHIAALFVAGSLFSASALFAQSTKSKTDYAKYPYWIKMMDDSTTNYYVALEAYDTFWKNHVKPEEEEEELMPKGVEVVKEHHRRMSKREKMRQIEEDKYKFECKRFEHWKHEVEPFVQEDGSILTNYQRFALWKKQNEERDKVRKQ